MTNSSNVHVENSAGVECRWGMVSNNTQMPFVSQSPCLVAAFCDGAGTTRPGTAPPRSALNQVPRGSSADRQKSVGIIPHALQFRQYDARRSGVGWNQDLVNAPRIDIPQSSATGAGARRKNRASAELSRVRIQSDGNENLGQRARSADRGTPKFRFMCRI